MINFFIGLIFFAEIVLVLNIVNKIMELDFKVNSLNAKVTKGKLVFKIALIDFRAYLQDFAMFLEKSILLFQQKREEYAIQAAKRVIFYLALLLLRGKYKKAFVAYSVAQEVVKGYKAGMNFI